MSENIKEIFARLINKHDLEVNWLANSDFVPMQGELIVYDRDETHTYERFKLGDGTTTVSKLPFVDETFILNSTKIIHGDTTLSSILDSYLLGIEDDFLDFDTTEIVI